MKISCNCFTWLLQNESYDPKTLREEVFTSRWDSVGGVYDIAWGLTTVNGKPVKKGKTISYKDAQDEVWLIVEKIENYITKIMQRDNVDLNQFEFDCMVDFAYNLGCSALEKSTLWKKLKEGFKDDVPSQLMRWNKASGKEVKGLTNRRIKECKLWEHHVYTQII